MSRRHFAGTCSWTIRDQKFQNVKNEKYPQNDCLQALSDWPECPQNETTQDGFFIFISNTYQKENILLKFNSIKIFIFIAKIEQMSWSSVLK